MFICLGAKKKKKNENAKNARCKEYPNAYLIS